MDRGAQEWIPRRVILWQRCENDKLHPDDLKEYGAQGKDRCVMTVYPHMLPEYVEHSDDDAVLDLFHARYPIALLENYEVEVQPGHNILRERR